MIDPPRDDELIGDVGRPLPAQVRWPRLPSQAAIAEHLRAIRLLAADHGTLDADVVAMLDAIERRLVDPR